jgi:hypothetical protein
VASGGELEVTYLTSRSHRADDAIFEGSDEMIASLAVAAMLLGAGRRRACRWRPTSTPSRQPALARPRHHPRRVEDGRQRQPRRARHARGPAFADSAARHAPARPPRLRARVTTFNRVEGSATAPGLDHSRPLAPAGRSVWFSSHDWRHCEELRLDVKATARSPAGSPTRRPLRNGKSGERAYALAGADDQITPRRGAAVEWRLARRAAAGERLASPGRVRGRRRMSAEAATD